MTENHELKGLGGWLILVGIGVVLSPIRLIFTIIPIYKPIFEDGVWQALTTEGSEDYIPHVSSLIVGELVSNTIIIAASIYLIYLFFKKHYLFPKVYIGIVIVSLVLIPLDAWMATIVFPDEPLFDSETTKEFMGALITAVIWVPYMIVSKRVKVTFVEKLPNKQIQQTSENIV